MKQITIAASVAVALATATAATAYSSFQTGSDAEDTVPAARAVYAGAYELGAPGEAARCRVWRGDVVADAGSRLETDGSCSAVYPLLASATLWRELDDGTIVFADAGGGTVLAFAAADGAGFESVEPVAPLLSLMPEEL